MSQLIQKIIVQNSQHKNLEKRLNYAKYLLVQTAEPVDEIALNCGWKSQKIFTYVFQKKVGVSPKHYRKWHQD